MTDFPEIAGTLGYEFLEGIAEETALNGANGESQPSQNGNGAAHDGNGAAVTSKAEARRIATKVGHGILAAKNLDAARHSDDVVVIAGAICDLLEIRGAERQDLLAAARLHDIGKAAVPSEILNKPGPLNEAEWELVRTHTVVGERILASVPELEGIARLVRHSHERWDGGGYPDGLAGEAIPLGSRIISCADAFHAIRTDRPYQAGRLPATALVELRRNAGTQFDPAVVAALDQVVRELRMVPARGHVRRSSRLSALLLMPAIGGRGARSPARARP